MCIIFAYYPSHGPYRCVIATNREESFARPSLTLAEWTDSPGVIAGRDAIAHGTWFGINSKTGRWAGITSVYVSKREQKGAATRSRGDIVTRWLSDECETPEAYRKAMEASEEVQEYGGAFNVFYGTFGKEEGKGEGEKDGGVYHYSNEPGAASVVGALGNDAVHGVSNENLDSRWPKVLYGKEKVKELVDTATDSESSERSLLDGLFAMLADRTVREPRNEFGTGRLEPCCMHWVDREMDFGTRCSTVVLVKRDGGVRVAETSYDGQGKVTGVIDKVV